MLFKCVRLTIDRSSAPVILVSEVPVQSDSLFNAIPFSVYSNDLCLERVVNVYVCSEWFKYDDSNVPSAVV